MTKKISPLHALAVQKETDDYPSTDLLQSIFSIISGNFNAHNLKKILGSNSIDFKPTLDEESQNPGGEITFLAHDSSQDLILTIIHDEQRNHLSIKAKKTDGLYDPLEILQKIHDILKNSTQSKMTFKTLEGQIAAHKGDKQQDQDRYNTQTHAIDYKETLKIPDELATTLKPIAEATTQRWDI